MDFSSYQFLTFDIFLEKFEFALTRKMANVEPALLFEAISAVFEVSLETSFLQLLIRKVLTRKLSLGQVEVESNEQILALLVDLESSLPQSDVHKAFSTASALLFPPDGKQTTSSSGMAQMLSEIALEKENWDSPVDSVHDEIRCSGIEVL